MALKRIYATLDEIPEELREHYTERDGQYVLDAEPGEGERNADDVARALRARDNEKAEREKVRQQLQELQSKLEGIDPERLPDAVSALSRLDELEHERLISEKKFEEAAEKKFERRLAELQRTIDAQKAENESLQAKFAAQRNKMQEVIIERSLQDQFLRLGADPEKLRFIMLDAKAKWELDPETDEPIPIDYIEGGKTKVTAMGKDGKPLTMEEHAKSLLAELPWAVLESRGSGSAHQTNAPGNGVILTETQAQDFRQFAAAKTQAEKAGVELQVVPG